ncbi:MAG TPA: c-type cytochrome [Noviherbaspirillum sp.]|uniref:c-type cytochrome n=1 Tax=Noviherbaspirillum sp. TaxID=1926288 RepID=UPI002D40CBF5|nr:c-type cytochrome [Noviherbaspirillum sp.]HYD96053.1 c-type cytochrome [Noviherbaspirillum sp.]
MKTILAGAALLLSFNAFAAGNVDAGKAAAEKYNCFSCHGKDYNTPIDPTYPKLAGQHQDYLAVAMIAYKRGADGANGRGNAIMAAQVKPLSSKDIQDIAAYLSSLPGTLVLRK